MRHSLLLVVIVSVLAAAGSARARGAGGSGQVQVQLGDLFMSDGRYLDAQQAYRRAVADPDAAIALRAGSGLVLALLRTGDFQEALDLSSTLVQRYPDSMSLRAGHGDALWSAGRFEEAETAYDSVLASNPLEPRARHGRARSTAARNRLTDALADATEAIRLAPRDGELYHTLAAIYERLRRFEDAATALSSYIDLLPDRDRSEKAGWARAEIRFLRSFGDRVPYDIEAHDGATTWTVPIRIRGDKVMVAGKVNGGSQEMLLDTGAERTVVSMEVAKRRGIVPIAAMQTAGVGGVGLRGLDVGRIETLEIGGLKVRNVPCLIKNPPLGGLPAREPESFSPLALGLSMRVDYEKRLLTMARSLEPVAYTDELPLRMHRLAFVRGTVNGRLPASFVVDTGGELLSISGTTAKSIQPEKPFRRIPLRVYGTSGWDKDAFLMPNVDLEFSAIRVSQVPVVVLNLRAPSALLGFELGGIVGHRFLSKYRISIDLNRSVLGLEASS